MFRHGGDGGEQEWQPAESCWRSQAKSDGLSSTSSDKGWLYPSTMCTAIHLVWRRRWRVFQRILFISKFKSLNTSRRIFFPNPHLIPRQSPLVFRGFSTEWWVVEDIGTTPLSLVTFQHTKRFLVILGTSSNTYTPCRRLIAGDQRRRKEGREYQTRRRMEAGIKRQSHNFDEISRTLSLARVDFGNSIITLLKVAKNSLS